MGHPNDWYDHVTDRAGHDLRYASTQARCGQNWGGDPSSPTCGRASRRSIWCLAPRLVAGGQGFCRGAVRRGESMTRWLVTGAQGQLGHHVANLLAQEDARRSRARISTSLREVQSRLRSNVSAGGRDQCCCLHVGRCRRRRRVCGLRRQLPRPRPTGRSAATRGWRPTRPRVDRLRICRYLPRAVPAHRHPGASQAYGRTKLAGEVAALDGFPGGVDIVRTAWVYGGPGANFVDTDDSA